MNPSLTNRQRHGFLTALFLIVTTSDAVTFWAAYQKRDRIASNSRTSSSCIQKTPDECVPESSSSHPNVPEPSSRRGALYRPSRLFPRTRIAHPMHHRGTSSRNDVDTLSSFCRYCETSCCKSLQDSSHTLTAASSILHVNVPRGGGGGGPMETLESTVAAAAAQVVGTSSTLQTPLQLPLNAWKVIFQCCLTAINVFFWWIPLKSKKITENKLTLSLANAFSGGVFLSLAFGHLIPECVSGFQNFYAQSSTTSSSLTHAILQNEALPYMLVLGGYLLIFFVEKIAFDAHGALHELEHAKDKMTPSSSSSTTIMDTHTSSLHHSNHEPPSISTSSSSKVGMPVGRSALILLAALAVHSILEMTALGLADSFGDCSLLSLSIALHQPAESIALLVAFVKSGMPQHEIIKYLSIFSAMGPIGFTIGMAVNEFASPVVDCIMLAIVAGTFVYVGATEVIPEEWEHSEHKWIKFLALMTGIVSIFAITQYTMTLDALS